MTPTREALTLPLLFLTVVAAGSLRLGTPLTFVAPSLFSLILAVLLIACLVQSRALQPALLIAAHRSALANLNGLALLLSLFVASAQVVTVVLPESGIPAVLMGILVLALLLQALAIGADRIRMLRGLLVSLALAFTLKFIVLAALSAPAATRTGRVVQLLFEGVTLGSVTQAPLHPAAGYLAFAVLLLYVFGVLLLPRGEHTAWVVPRPSGERAGTLERR